MAQLQAEVYQCQLLIQAAAERLAILAQYIHLLQAAGSFPEGTDLPPQAAAANHLPGDLPPQVAAANPYPYNLPPEITVANTRYSDLPLSIAAANLMANGLPPTSMAANLLLNGLPLTTVTANAPGKTPTVKQLSRVLKQHEFGKTTEAHINRTAQLMLFIRQHPGEPRGVQPYAKLLGMGYRGAGKFLTLTYQRGLITRTAFKVYALTQKGEQYVQEALIPVVLD